MSSAVVWKLRKRHRSPRFLPDHDYTLRSGLCYRKFVYLSVVCLSVDMHLCWWKYYLCALFQRFASSAGHHRQTSEAEMARIEVILLLSLCFLMSGVTSISGLSVFEWVNVVYITTYNTWVEYNSVIRALFVKLSAANNVYLCTPRASSMVTVASIHI